MYSGKLIFQVNYNKFFLHICISGRPIIKSFEKGKSKENLDKKIDKELFTNEN